MFWADAAKGAMLDAIDESAVGLGMKFGSLHTAYSTTGASEVTGGSPAYARVALTWAAAAGAPRTKALAATLPTWNVPAATTVGWWGMWDAVTVGNFLGMMPLGAGALRVAGIESADLVGNTIQSPAHGYAVNDRVVLWGTLPAATPALAVGTIYFVGTVPTADTFTLSTTTANGAPVDITGIGDFFVQKCVPQTTVTQDTISLASGSVDLNAVA